MNAYSKLNPPPGHYVYAYLRENGTPYYIGKGKDNRAWINHRTLRNGSWTGIQTPPDRRIVIMEANLLEIGSLALERRYIAWYGRLDTTLSGLLRNLTDGGDGICGAIQSGDTIEKRRASRKANKRPNPLKGTKQSPEVIEKKRQAMLGQKHTPERNANRSAALKGRKLSPEHIAKRSATVTGRKLGPQPVITCPHCGTSGGCGVMKRHHFDNCKQR